MIAGHKKDVERLAELEPWLEQAKVRLEKAKKDCEEARLAEDVAHSEVVNLERLCAVLRSRLGASAPASKTDEITQPEQAKNTQNKAEFIRGQLAAAADKGIAPVEVRRAMHEQGFRINQNYPNTILGKLKKRGKAITRNGRYFPTKELTVRVGSSS